MNSIFGMFIKSLNVCCHPLGSLHFWPAMYCYHNRSADMQKGGLYGQMKQIIGMINVVSGRRDTVCKLKLTSCTVPPLAHAL